MRSEVVHDLICFEAVDQVHGLIVLNHRVELRDSMTGRCLQLVSIKTPVVFHCSSEPRNSDIESQWLLAWQSEEVIDREALRAYHGSFIRVVVALQKRCNHTSQGSPLRESNDGMDGSSVDVARDRRQPSFYTFVSACGVQTMPPCVELGFCFIVILDISTHPDRSLEGPWSIGV